MEVETLDSFGWVKSLAAYCGSYCSIIVLAYLLFKLLMDLVLVSITLLREESVEVAALLIEFYSSSPGRSRR